jgi:hypothetical protein
MRSRLNGSWRAWADSQCVPSWMVARRHVRRRTAAGGAAKPPRQITVCLDCSRMSRLPRPCVREATIWSMARRAIRSPQTGRGSRAHHCKAILVLLRAREYSRDPSSLAVNADVDVRRHITVGPALAPFGDPRTISPLPAGMGIASNARAQAVTRCNRAEPGCDGGPLCSQRD